MNTDFPPPVLYMAPLKGITDHVFRRSYRDHFGGFHLAMAPFISSKQDHRFKPKYIRDVLPENNPNLPVVPQIMSKDAADFCALANYLHETGYQTVNWNLGCPFPMVAKKQRGCGLLPHTEAIQEFLAQTIPNLAPRLSIKLRLGWLAMDDLLRLIPILNQYPLAEIILHPRTGVQRYTGQVDLAAFGQCLPLIAHPVVYNGDIRNQEDFDRLKNQFPRVDRWMIGRGLLMNPFLPEQIGNGLATITSPQMRLKQFHGDLFEAYSSYLQGPAHVLNKMKGLWRYLAALFGDCQKAVKQIKKTRHPQHYLTLANQFFDTHAPLPHLPSNLPCAAPGSGLETYPETCQETCQEN